MLEIHELTKIYKKTHALSNFSLTLNKPEIIGLFGHNGAGKSTLLKILAGILDNTSGKWTFNDLSIKENRREYLKYIGYMPDDFDFPSYLTIYETLAYYGSLRGQKKEDILHTLKIVGLEDIKHERTTKLSKGMKQRLLFAQAIIGKPKLILLDEPTNGLDNIWTKQLKETIVTMHEQGTTILISSHQHDFLNEICHTKVYISAGKISEISS